VHAHAPVCVSVRLCLRVICVATAYDVRHVARSYGACHVSWRSLHSALQRGAAEKGCVLWSRGVTDRFCEKNNIQLIVRSHEVFSAG